MWELRMNAKFDRDRQETAKGIVIAVMNFSFVCVIILEVFGKGFFAMLPLVIGVALSSMISIFYQKKDDSPSAIMRKKKMEQMELRIEEIEKCWKI